MPDRDEEGAAAALSGVRSVARTLEIMSLLREDRPAITLREIQAETGLPRTTLVRLLSTLEQFGLLWGTGRHRYVPGPGLMRWAGLARDAWEMPAEARQALRELVQRTRETAGIYVRQNVRRICIAQEQSPRALRHVTRIGRESPLNAAPGRVLIRDLSEEDLMRVAQDSPDAEQRMPLLREWQREVKANGYAVTHGEREDGLSVVAVPLVDSQGKVVAALTLAGPTGRFSEDKIAHFLDALKVAAISIEQSSFMMFTR
jgi:DNA-binding IclR family transcriptional regulator